MTTNSLRDFYYPFNPYREYMTSGHVWTRDIRYPNDALEKQTFAAAGLEFIQHDEDNRATDCAVDGCRIVERRRGDHTWKTLWEFESHDTAQKAFIALGVWLMVNRNSNCPILVFEHIEEAKFDIVDRIENWDTKNIEQLKSLLEELEKFPSDTTHLIDMTALPSAPIPDDIDTSYPVWAMDQSGNMLVGTDADQTMTIEEYREELAEED